MYGLMYKSQTRHKVVYNVEFHASVFYFGTREKVQQLSMCGTLAEYPSSILSTHVGCLTTACKSGSRKSDTSGPLGILQSLAHNSHILVIKIKI